MDHILQQTKSRNTKSKRNKRSAEDSLLKVVYISSPMKVTTSASRFRTLVQELTGRESDISQFMDGNNPREAQDFEILPAHENIERNNQHDQMSLLPSIRHLDHSPKSSGSLSSEQPPSFGDMLFNEQYYQNWLTSNYFSKDSEFDVLRSYDAL